MEKVIYSNNGELGIILSSQDQEASYFLHRCFRVNDNILVPGFTTTLDGLYSSPVRFVGCLKDDEQCMVFHLGSDSDLFDSKEFYSCFYWIAENRVLNKYREGSARDFIYVNGAWK